MIICEDISKGLRILNLNQYCSDGLQWRTTERRNEGREKKERESKKGKERRGGNRLKT